MITQIGIVAGEILELLEEKKRPVSMSELKSHLDESVDVIYMAIGWLVRSGYVHPILTEGEQYLFLISEESISSSSSKTLKMSGNI